VKKILFIVIDGLGDEPIPQLGNKTPLEAAKIPNLDWLAKNGICGLVEPFLSKEQAKPESDTCHLALFGYDLKKYYLGRGSYEAAGIGFNLKEGDLALRANFATIDQNLKVIDRRAGRIEKTEPLIKFLNGIEIDGVKFLFKKAFGHRAVLILRGGNLSPKISSNDPKITGVRPLSILSKGRSRKAKFTAQVLNAFLGKAHEILKNHKLNKKRTKEGLLPANYLLVRGPGILKNTPPFSKRYNLKACCIAEGTLYKGIGKILGMDLIKVKGANGLPNTNLKGKFSAAKKAIGKYNFIFLHIKAADSLAEDGNFIGKKEFIEKIDRNIKTLLKLKKVLIVVTADHSTCSLLKRHCLESIPILIYGNGKDGVQKFSEKTCKKGNLGKIKQIDLMPKILKLTCSFDKK